METARSHERGFAPMVPIILVGIIAAAVGLLYSAHEPGNPPPWAEDSETIVSKSGAETVSALPDDVQAGNIVAQSPRSPSPPAQASEQTEYREPGCASNTNPIFTKAFTDLSTINALNPIGGIGGGSPARGYIGVKEGMEAPIYAPTDATIRTIINVDRGIGKGEYGVFLTVSCEVEILFDHIDRLSDRLLPYAPKTVTASTRTDGGTEPRIPIKAGELIGFSNGTELARTWDFLVTNYGRKNSYLVPKRWQWDQAVYGSCPYDYFVEDLRLQYYAKLGKPSNTGLIKATECGNPSHDISGSASGGWFKGDNSTDTRGEYLAVAREFDEVMVAYRKDGNAFANMQDVQAGKPYFNVTDYSPAQYPADITLGESICYSGNGRWAYIRLDTATQLSVAMGTGECPTGFPDAQAETWVR